MTKTKLLTKYLLISFVASNIPWLVFGPYFGWPVILVFSAIFTYFDKYLSELSKLEIFSVTLFFGFFLNILNNVGLNFFIKQDLLGLGLTFLTIPSTFIGALLVTNFHTPKKTSSTGWICRCEDCRKFLS